MQRSKQDAVHYDRTLQRGRSNWSLERLPPSTAIEAAQALVNRHFEEEADIWNQLYEDRSLLARVFQHRQALALQWVDRLGLEPGSPVLEVGCGAGHMAAALANRGFRVKAIDSVQSMVEMTEQRLLNDGLRRTASAKVGDVNSLHFEDQRFQLVVAVGVLDWVTNPLGALREMVRVLKPGGCLIITCGHPAALVYVVEPLLSGGGRAALRWFRWLLRRPAMEEVIAEQKLYSCRSLDRLVTAVGLTTVDRRTVGFGPFTVLGRRLVPEAAGLAVHQRLQALADRRLPVVRSAGMGYMVLARKLP
jgi:ubiquinone/menaquinone biosynthesis C-methylase UbiE